jgi:FK506-binding nuclear protein
MGYVKHLMSRDITNANVSSPLRKYAGVKKKPKKKMKKQKETEGENQSNARTLDDGLIVEDLSTGNRDPKMPSIGGKVPTWLSLTYFQHVFAL